MLTSNARSTPVTPSYQGLTPASENASAAARGASRKTDTSCELLLRRSLWRTGCRYRVNVAQMPGKPDLVFSKARLIVFCDGDFWHGKDWQKRRAKLEQGANPGYWVAKIQRNIERDTENTEALEAAGWTVLRFWESEIKRNTQTVTQAILEILDGKGHRQHLGMELTRT